MIVVDSSALMAILLQEPDEGRFYDALAGEASCVMSAVNAHECITVLRIRKGAAAIESFWILVADLRIDISPFDEAQVRAAAVAFLSFGKGIHAQARLNLCDCAAYALAKTRGAPLLFKGDDFSHTDLVSAL